MAATDTDDSDLMAGINVTPLVDIFLVLLIIFMITSSVVEYREIPVNLPKAAHVGSEAPKSFGLVIDIENRLYLNGMEMDSLDVYSSIREGVEIDSVSQVLISADEEMAYRHIVSAIDLVRSAGVTKYALKVVRPK